MERPVKKHITHSELLNADNLYECPECSKCFPKYVSLYKHRRIHTGERPYGCETCGRRFVQKIHLTVHRRMHTGERPFECEECDKKFAKKFHLTNHMRVHTGIKTVPCDLCDKYFGTNSQLKSHRRTHFEEREFKCDLCHREYKHQTVLKLHIARYHFGEKPVYCTEPECREGFWNRFALKKHLIKVHKKKFPEKVAIEEHSNTKHIKTPKASSTGLENNTVAKPVTRMDTKKAKNETAYVASSKPVETTEPLEEEKVMNHIKEVVVEPPLNVEQPPAVQPIIENQYDAPMHMTSPQQQQSLQNQQNHVTQFTAQHLPTPPQPHSQIQLPSIQPIQNFMDYQAPSALAVQPPQYLSRPTFPDHLLHQFDQTVDESCSPSPSPGMHFTNSPPSSPEVQQPEPRPPSPPLPPPRHTQLKLPKSGNTTKKRKPKPTVDCPHCGISLYDRYALKRHIIGEHDGVFINVIPIKKSQQPKQPKPKIKQPKNQPEPDLQIVQPDFEPLSQNSHSQSQNSSQHSDIYQQQQPQLQQIPLDHSHFLQQNALNYSVNNFMNSFMGYGGQFRNN